MGSRRWLTGALVLMVMLVVVTPGRLRAQQSPARVRVVHAAPDTAPVDVFVDDQKVLSDVAFPSISQYLEVPAGTHTLSLTPSGQPLTAAVLQTSVSVDAAKAYTVAAIGLSDVTATVYTDDLSALPPGKARVRFIHAAPDAPGADIEVINGPTLFSNIGFGVASDYRLVDAGTYDLRAVVAGANTVIVQLPDTTLNEGTIYEVVAAGRLANIQVEVGTAAPIANQPVLGSEGAAPSAAQNTMPNTGSADSLLWFGFVGLLLMTAGLLVRGRGRASLKP